MVVLDNNIKSQDERIRKELTEFLKKASGGFLDTTTRCKTFGKWFAWLEKQGKKTNPYSGISFEYNGHIWGMCARDNGVDILLDKHLIGHLGNEQITANSVKTCKVEPKFKINDWITNGQLTCKVLSVTSKSYELHLYNDDYCHFETDIQSVDKDYHLWSIKDARCGDVLTSGKSIFIFKEECMVDDMVGKPTAYCGLLNNIFHISSGGSCWTDKKCYPATKEQQDLFFSKMQEEGWSWNATTKELSQSKEAISEQILGNSAKTCNGRQNTAWSEKDEKMYRGIHNLIYATPYCNSRQEFSDWLKTFKQRYNE